MNVSPNDLTNSDLDKAVAEEVLGCKPHWNEHYREWCCSCDDDAHMIDQQCSVLPSYSMDKRYAAQVAEKAELDISIRAPARDICIAALNAARRGN